MQCRDIKVYTERVTGLAATKSKLTYDCKFLAAALPHAECAYNVQTGCVEGAVFTVLVYEQNGEIKSTDVSLPFAVALNGVAEDGERVAEDVAVCGVSVRLKAEGEAEAEATLKICASVCGEQSVRYLTRIEEGEPSKLTTARYPCSCLPRATDCGRLQRSLTNPPKRFRPVIPTSLSRCRARKE